MRLRTVVLILGFAVLVPSIASAQEGRSQDPAAGAVDPAVEAEARQRYRRAEQERRAAERIRFVAPRRATTIEKLSRWARDYFAPTFTRRIEATQRAVRAYEEVHRAGQTRYSIAAARRVGDLYLAIATTLESIPVPIEIRRDPELLRIYQTAILDQATPLREQALDSYEAALRFAERLGQTTGPHLGRARAQLQQLAPDRLPQPAATAPAP